MNTLQLETGQKERRKMIRYALKEKNPALFLQLKKSRELVKFVEEREQELWAAYMEGWNETMWNHSQEKNTGNKNLTEYVRDLEADLRVLWESLLETYLEFSQSDYVIPEGLALGSGADFLRGIDTVT